jgi:epsin
MNTIPSFTDIKDTLFNTITRNKEIITGVVTGASETIKLVVTTTNNEQWGPTGPQMRQIAELTFNYADCTQIMETVWERLETDINFAANWRIIYKSLLLLDYIIRNGSERVVNDARQNVYQIKGLGGVHFIDSEGIDRGVSIRERSKQVVELLGDTVRLREERKKCKQNRDKYSTAYGNDSYDYRNSGRTSSNSTLEDDDFPTNRHMNRASFSLTEEDFKDDDFKDDVAPKRSSTIRTTTKRVQPADDFGPYAEPSVTTPNISNIPAKPNPPPPTTHTTTTTTNPNWDPFSSSTNLATTQSWDDDFNPRQTTPNTSSGIDIWPSQPPLISPPITNPGVSTSNPLGPSIRAPNIPNNQIPNLTTPVLNPSTGSTTNIPPNLFVNTPTPNIQPPSNPGFSVNPSVNPKTNQVPPILKPNDPWAAQHLFNLSPRNNSSSSSTTTAKPLGATVGTGWGMPNTTSTVPVAYTYPPTMPVTYPVAYTTYPVATPNMYSTPNYSNTSQWGI